MAKGQIPHLVRAGSKGEADELRIVRVGGGGSVSRPTTGTLRSLSTNAGSASGSSITVTVALDGPERSDSVSHDSAEKDDSVSSSVSVAERSPGVQRQLAFPSGDRSRQAWLDRRDAPLPRQLPGQRKELELGQEPDDCFAVGLVRHQGPGVELDRHVTFDGDQLARKASALGLGQERFPGSLRGDFAGSGENGLQVAELRQQLLGSFLSDPLHPGMLSDESPTKARKSTTWPGGTPSRSEAFLSSTQVSSTAAPSPPRIQQGHPGPDQLVEILVSRNDDHLQPPPGPGLSQRADDVVRLIAGDGVQRDSECFQQLADSLDRPSRSRPAARCRAFPGQLVVGVALFPEGRAGVVDPGDVVGRYISRRRRRKLTTPHAAEVFPPLAVRSGREIIAKKAR